MELFSEREGCGDYAIDDDEEKMEEFFAILRSFRHAFRNRKRDVAGEEGRPAKRSKLPAPARSSSWVPKFEWEDFNTTVDFRGAVSADSAPVVVIKKKENTEEEEEEEEEEEAKCKVEELVRGEEDDGNSLLKLTLSL